LKICWSTFNDPVSFTTDCFDSLCCVRGDDVTIFGLLALILLAWIILRSISNAERRKRAEAQRQAFDDDFKPSEFPDSGWFHDPKYRPQAKPFPKYYGRVKGRGTGR